jgi:methyl-accepting chemotaxis protein
MVFTRTGAGKGMKLGVRILSAFLLVAVVILAMGIVGYSGIGGVSAQLDRTVRLRLTNTRSLLTLRETQILVAAAENGVVNGRPMNPDIRTAQYQVIKQAMHRADDAYNVLASIRRTGEEETLWKEFAPRWDRWKKAQLKIVDIMMERDKLVAGGVALSDGKIEALDAGAFSASRKALRSFPETMECLEKMAAHNEQKILHAGLEVGATERKAKMMMVGAVLVALLSCIGCGVFLAGRIGRPLGALAESAAKLAKGDLNAAFDYKSCDEIGHLAGSLRMMAGNFRNITSRISNSMEKVLEGLKAATSSLSTASAHLNAGNEVRPRQPLKLVVGNQHKTETLRKNTGEAEKLALLAEKLTGKAEELRQMIGVFKMPE